MAADARALEARGAREVNELHWTTALELAWRKIGKTRANARAAPKSADGKVAVAAWLKFEPTPAATTADAHYPSFLDHDEPAPCLRPPLPVSVADLDRWQRVQLEVKSAAAKSGA